MALCLAISGPRLPPLALCCAAHISVDAGDIGHGPGLCLLWRTPRGGAWFVGQRAKKIVHLKSAFSFEAI